MPLPAGVILDRKVHPRSSWPKDPPAPLVAASPGKGRSHRARKADDGSRWCAYGDHTVDPRSKIERCESCRLFRDQFRHTEAAEDFISLPKVVVQALLDNVDPLIRATARLDALLAIHEDPTIDDIHALRQSAVSMSAISQILVEYTQSRRNEEARWHEENRA